MGFLAFGDFDVFGLAAFFCLGAEVGVAGAAMSTCGKPTVAIASSDFLAGERKWKNVEKIVGSFI